MVILEACTHCSDRLRCLSDGSIGTKPLFPLLLKRNVKRVIYPRDTLRNSITVRNLILYSGCTLSGSLTIYMDRDISLTSSVDLDIDWLKVEIMPMVIHPRNCVHAMFTSQYKHDEVLLQLEVMETMHAK